MRPDLVYTAVEHSRDIVEWTEGFGAVWTVDDALYFGQTAYRMHTTDGEGILWGEEFGASLQNMGAYQSHAFHGVDNDKTLEQGVANNGGIIVNRDGNRFMNEYGGYSEMSPHVLAQPDGIGYLVFTDVQRELSRKFPRMGGGGYCCFRPVRRRAGRSHRH